MIQKVYELLSTVGVPVDHIQRPKFSESNKQVISYHLFGPDSIQNGDGEERENGGSLQVDLFVVHDCKTNPSMTIKAIKRALKYEKFRLYDKSESGYHVEGVGSVDQYTFKFNYIEMEE